MGAAYEASAKRTVGRLLLKNRKFYSLHNGEIGIKVLARNRVRALYFSGKEEPLDDEFGTKENGEELL